MGNDAHRDEVILWGVQVCIPCQPPNAYYWIFLDKRHLAIVQRKLSFKKEPYYIMTAKDRTKIKAHSKELGTISFLHYWVMPQSMGCWRQQGHQIGQAKTFTFHAPWPPLWNVDLQNRTASLATKWHFYFCITFMILLLDNRKVFSNYVNLTAVWIGFACLLILGRIYNL